MLSFSSRLKFGFYSELVFYLWLLGYVMSRTTHEYIPNKHNNYIILLLLYIITISYNNIFKIQFKFF